MKQNIQRLKYIDVYNYFKNRGFTLLSKEYINNSSKLEYLCNKCNHIIFSTYQSFKATKFGCPKCAMSFKKSKKFDYEFVKKTFEDRGYELLSEKYENIKSKLLYKCPNGHIGKICFDTFKHGTNCMKCSIATRTERGKLKYSDVKKYIEDNGYKIISTEYIKSKSHIELECPNGHHYSVTFDNFKRGKRCPHCNPMYSKAEKQIVEFIKQYKIIIENDRKLISPLELDIYVPELKLAIEYCGLYWHNDEHVNRNYHRVKLDRCNSLGIRLITIFEDEWVNKQEICKSRILHALGVQNNRIYARKCELREISSKLANEFYVQNHLQGATRGKLHVGLFNEGILVQAMTIGELSRKHVANKTLELKRMACLNGYSIIGGASKLFKYVSRYTYEHNYNYIRSYCDLRWGVGGVYSTLNFNLKTESKYTPHYVMDTKRYRNQSLRKTNEEKLTGKTEYELRKEQGYTRIWDCGHQTWDYSMLTEQWQKLFSYNLKEMVK